MRPLGKRLERLPSLVADLPQHFDPHPLHEGLAHGDVVDGQMGDHFLRLRLQAEPGQGVADGPAAIERSFGFSALRFAALPSSLKPVFLYRPVRLLTLALDQSSVGRR
jgi:hypothetical protein